MNTPLLSLLPPGGAVPRGPQRTASTEEPRRFSDQLQSEVARSRNETSTQESRQAAPRETATWERQEEAQNTANASQDESLEERDVPVEPKGAAVDPGKPAEDEAESEEIVDEVTLSLEVPPVAVEPPVESQPGEEVEAELAVVLSISPQPVDITTPDNTVETETGAEPAAAKIAAATKSLIESRPAGDATESTTPSGEVGATEEEADLKIHATQPEPPTPAKSPLQNPTSSEQKPQGQPGKPETAVVANSSDSAGSEAAAEREIEAVSPTLTEAKSAEETLPKPNADEGALIAERTTSSDSRSLPPASPLRSQATSNFAARQAEAISDERPQVDPARFVSRVARAFAAAGERGGSIQLRLSPPELGAVRIELNVQQGVLSAHLETESAAAKSVLLDNLPALRERLAAQDIRVERFDVDVRQESTGGQPDWQAQQQSREQHQGRHMAGPAQLRTRQELDPPVEAPAMSPLQADGRFNAVA